MLFRWWRHKQLDGDSGRKATNIRPKVDKSNDFLISPLKYLQGTYEGSQRHGCEVGWVLVLVAVMTKVQVEVVWEMTDVI